MVGSQAVQVEFPMNYLNMPSSAPARHADSNHSDVDMNKVFQDLLVACRIGDTDTVDSLTLIPKIDVNQVDEWDYSPLVLASLCGHLSVVELLLARGAVCDRDTFQGARCIYGALNDEIRTLLWSYDITTRVVDTQPFLAHISRLLAPAFTLLSARDLAIVFPHAANHDHRHFVVNRFLLAARSPYFRRNLLPGGSWHAKSVVVMPEVSDADSFKPIVDYIYLRTDLLPLESPPDQFRLFAKKLQLTALVDAMEKMPKDRKAQARAKQQALMTFVDVAKSDLEAFLKSQIFDNARQVVLEEDVNFEDIDAPSLLDPSIHDELLKSSAISDIVMSSIDIDSGSVKYYPVHRAVLARSEFYSTMLRSEMFQNSYEEAPLVEANDIVGDRPIDRMRLETSHVPVLQALLSTTKPQVTEIILLFLYYDDVLNIPSNLSVELLFAAEELLIERLKTMSALSITSLVEKFDYNSLVALPDATGYDVCDLVEISWQTRCDRLEQHMTKLIAHNIQEICNNVSLRERLLELIRKSAHRILERQDTDTIELVDDIRYYMAKKYLVYDEFQTLDGIAQSFNPTDNDPDEITVNVAELREYEQDIAMIDTILDELDLNA